MKKAERKEKYCEVLVLMLKGENKQAFEKLCSMCGKDTGLFVLVDYDKKVSDFKANLPDKNKTARVDLNIARTLIADIKTWDVSECLLLPDELRSRMQAVLDT